MYLSPTEIALAELLLTLLYWIANLGGIAVLVGAYFVHKGRTSTGKFLVGIGAGVGIINLLLLLIPSFLGGSLLETYLLILGIASTTYGLGILLTIIGRLKA